MLLVLLRQLYLRVHDRLNRVSIVRTGVDLFFAFSLQALPACRTLYALPSSRRRRCRRRTYVRAAHHRDPPHGLLEAVIGLPTLVLGVRASV